MKSVEVSEELTRKVAQLARLELSDQEVRTFTLQLSEVLKYVESLQAVDVSGIEPLTHPLELATPMREDIARPSNPKVLHSAPEALNGGYKVPPIL